MYIIQKINNIDDIENKVSNADIRDFSNLSEENEVLLFPFSCFEIIDIKKMNLDYDYEIHLKYLGSYSEYIEKKFDINFFDKIQLSNFSEELLKSGILKIHNFFATWLEKKKFEIKVNEICFLLEGEEDCISFRKNEIIVFSIYLWEIKQTINIHEDEILNVAKITFNRIISSSKDGKVKIVKMHENNTKSEVIYDIDLKKNMLLKFYF